MRSVILFITATFVAIQADLPAQNRQSLVGTWRLVSTSASTPAGRRIDPPIGSNPTGLITYTAEGTMMAIISSTGRKPLSGDRISAPAAERAEAFATFFAYAGRYSLEGDKVIHHVEIASVQNWVNTDMVRMVTFENNRIILRTPPLSVGGKLQTTVLVWERVN
jgi:lipocalin-like protein